MKESAPAEIVEFTEPRIIFGSQGEDSLQPITEKARRFIAARLAASVLLDALDLRGRDLEHNEACIMMALQHVAVVKEPSFHAVFVHQNVSIESAIGVFLLRSVIDHDAWT